MITVQQYHQLFIERHDFQYEDIGYLPNKYPHIFFRDIPESWVCPIEKYLSKIKDITKIRKIQQVMGFLNIDYSYLNKKDYELLSKLESILLEIDIDLVEQLDSIGDN